MEYIVYMQNKNPLLLIVNNGLRFFCSVLRMAKWPSLFTREKRTPPPSLHSKSYEHFVRFVFTNLEN